MERGGDWKHLALLLHGWMSDGLGAHCLNGGGRNDYVSLLEEPFIPFSIVLGSYIII